MQANEIMQVRRRFYICMWLVYCGIVGISTLVAAIRFLLGEDGTLHHFISTTSNHLVLVSHLSVKISISICPTQSIVWLQPVPCIVLAAVHLERPTGP